MSWNARDQLTGMGGAVTASFGYDGLGRRRTKTVSGSKTDYLYDGVNFVQEKDGATVKANVLTGLGLDEVYRRTQAGVASDYLPDALGSTVALTDASRVVQTQYSYAPYGETTQTGAANANTQKYTGREDDGTGLMYYRARYSSPLASRFISEDPIGFEGGSNLYEYVGSSPADVADPIGLSPDSPFSDFGSTVPDLHQAAAGGGRDWQSEQVLSSYARAWVVVTSGPTVAGGARTFARAAVSTWSAMPPAQRIEFAKAVIEIGDILSRAPPPRVQDIPQRSPYDYVRIVRDASRRPLPTPSTFPRFPCPR